ncbi:hypothetical protein CROQUDRAFT_665072 [Cronartium quercuum f. sp. fusiforme G11]|uniref:RING-type domain-containing protein n=1 Tax=Cronartium quercuum f. sp. fusiforme G11 TaxID=708437 RepID=A0A9P6NB60_9BASI|nr:hypothetical protein CROQUDRAFT_665072 [Cronartium quercuum f. sp. fusiforme G11]
MDDSLKCNIVSCRKSVSRDAKAVVTNCSHIFCLNCANTHASLTHPDPYPVCPACDSQLTEPEDVVCTSLNPSADYKSSVLSGLPPAIVLEIASRALNFWAYQQSMEATFQHMILKQAHERAATAEKDRDNIQNEAANEIRMLSERLTLSETELSNERRKVTEAAERYRNSQKQYEKLKANFERVRIQSLVNGVPDHRTETPLGQPRQAAFMSSQVTPARGAPAARADPDTRYFGTPPNEYGGAPRVNQLPTKNRTNLNILTLPVNQGHSFRSVRNKLPSTKNMASKTQIRSIREDSGEDNYHPMSRTAHSTGVSYDHFNSTNTRIDHLHPHLRTTSNHSRRRSGNLLHQPRPS